MNRLAWIVLASSLVAASVSAQSTDPYAGLRPLTGDGHIHPGNAVGVHGYNALEDPNLYEPPGPGCLGGNPPNASTHSWGNPKSVCEAYRDSGYDFAMLTPHHEKSCITEPCNVDGRPDLYAWWRDPNNIGVTSGWPLNAPEPAWNNLCGFRDFTAADPATTCVNPPTDEILSMKTAADAANQSGSFVCFPGHEWNGGNAAAFLKPQCLAADPVGAGLASSMGHLNIVYPSSFQSHCIRSNDPASDPNDFCTGEDAVYEEVRRTGSILINNHPAWNQGDDPDSCMCTSFVAPGGCNSTFVPRSEGYAVAGYDDRELDLIEVHGSSAKFGINRFFDSVMLAWNRGFASAISYGSDNHGTCPFQPLSPSTDNVGALVVWADSVTRGGILSGVKARRTYVITGFLNDAASAKFWMEEGSQSVPMGGFVEVLDQATDIYAELRGEQAYIDLDPVNNKWHRIELIHNDPNYQLGDHGDLRLHGEIVHTCVLDNPGPGCNCTTSSVNHGCTIALDEVTVQPGFYFLLAKNSANRRKLMTSAIWVNRCGHIERTGSGVPCVSNRALLSSPIAPPPAPSCSDGVDNDRDGLIDLGSDPGCTSAGDTSERESGGLACDDGVDHAGDGNADFPADAGRIGSLDTDERDLLAGACDDGVDNDLDGVADFPADAGCISPTGTGERDPTAAACDDGLDNDQDGTADFPGDAGCSGSTDTDERDPAGATCDDGLDNDGDGLADFPADPGCADALDADERDTAGPECDDGIDNDLDFLVDFPADPGCSDPFDDSEITTVPVYPHSARRTGPAE